MIEEVGATKLLRTHYDGDLYSLVASKLEDITAQSNRLPLFIQNGSCSFHNETDAGKRLYEWAELKDFVSFVKNNLKEYLHAIGADEQNVSVAGMWANRYPPGTFVEKHNHNPKRKPGIIVIGALYYIRKDIDAGNLVIDIPDYGEYNVDMNEGDLVIFQSSLNHWTIPNRSDRDKYIIGFELVVGEKGMTLDEL